MARFLREAAERLRAEHLRHQQIGGPPVTITADPLVNASQSARERDLVEHPLCPDWLARAIRERAR
jgi:hypothetical protein